MTLFPVLSFARHILTALVAGGAGAAVVYPVDVVKTRLQSQDSNVQIYHGPVDCLRKICRDEGIPGLYAGIIPQVLGVAPEKGLKVSVYSSLLPWFVASPLASYGWVLPVTAAGFAAGACQVAVTNPLEVTKIRLQMQNIDEPDKSKRKSVIEICQELGFSGLYQGMGCTVSRDIPSVAIFWVFYEGVKHYFAADGTDLTSMQYLIAGLIAGVPAASLVTPMDVVKTRWQAKGGNLKYSSPVDCLKTVLREEGYKTLWAGAGARVVRISPQLGVTLAIYEILEPHVH